MELDKIENRRYGPGERIELDGKSFSNCAFDGCEVIYGGEQTFWRDATWRNCRFTLVGSASYTVQVLKAIGLSARPPDRHSINGTGQPTAERKTREAKKIGPSIP
jgi:hypothetical protein